MADLCLIALVSSAVFAPDTYSVFFDVIFLSVFIIIVLMNMYSINVGERT